MTVPHTKQIVFVSDLHFGANPGFGQKNRLEAFIAFLDTLKSNTSHLFILGDLFEFWMEYRYYIPKDHFPLLAKLYELAEHRLEIHYQSGNHDFNLGSFFDKTLGITTHTKPWVAELQGLKCLLLHGDGLALFDWKYRLAKRFLNSSLANRGFKLIHPDLGMSVAKYVGKFSRDHSPEAVMEHYKGPALELLKKYEAQVIIHGHTHYHHLEIFPEGSYLQTGEWIKKFKYTTLTQGQFELKEFIYTAENPK